MKRDVFLLIALLVAAPAHAQHDMSQMNMTPEKTPVEGSGTSWLPAATPMYAIHRDAGGWMLMFHGNVFVQYLHDSGDRGSNQTGSVNWFMAMADRSVGDGHLGLRGMVSLEPWTIRGCGYPDLLASGEICNGETIHDRQHPHDLFMEIAAEYDRPLAGAMRLQVYGGPAAEPALGPAAFPHRVSAMANPLAPITHHWLDATHVSFGVITAGVYGHRWKAEGSVFNGREPDEHRTGFDFGALDSYSGRFSLLPSDAWALQVSAGHLKEAEAGLDGAPRTDVNRVTASATYQRVTDTARTWATTMAWGRNQEPGRDVTNAFVAETSLTLSERHTWFGRFELSEKSGHDLAIESDGLFTVAKLQAGYTRYFTPGYSLQPGIGAGLSLGIVPESLHPYYSRRVNPGVAVFFTVRPGRATLS